MTANGHYYVASSNVLGLSTNTAGFRWSYGSRTPEGSAEAYNACDVRLRLTVTDDESAFVSDEERAEWGKYHYFSGAPGGDLIAYRRSFLFGSELRLDARGLLSDEPHIVVNRNYYRFVTHRFMNLHSAGYILTDLASLLLLRRGYAPLHCSAFRIGDASVVVLAPPNTGKTLSTMMTCMEHGAEFVAEDLAITDGVRVHSVPWTSTFRYYSNVDQRVGTRVLNKATEWVPLLELLPLGRSQPINVYVEDRRILDSADITHVVVLERGEEQIVEESDEEMHRRAINLNRYEFNYHKAPVSVAYEYFNPSLDLDASCAAERQVLKKMVSGAAHRWIVRAQDPTRYAQLIVERLRNA